MNTIITIGRQFGSAGREIGEKLAEAVSYTHLIKKTDSKSRKMRRN